MLFRDDFKDRLFLDPDFHVNSRPGNPARLLAPVRPVKQPRWRVPRAHVEFATLLAVCAALGYVAGF